jgi:uncharacterized protein YgbK (DUF1537 family)
VTAEPRPAGPVLGAVADDLTGATDLAGTWVRAGVPTVVHVGVPVAAAVGALDVPAVVVATRIRTAPVADAVATATAAAGALRVAGARRLLWKYCSTFDSTPAGNIGPVADALADLSADLAGPAAGTGPVVACPAFPANGRTVYAGHLFVHGVPLAESPMADHPLTPMTDSDLVRWLGRQTPRAVGLVPYTTVAAGPGAVAARLAELAGAGMGHAVTDALDESHLAVLAEALADAVLVGGGSAIGGALAPVWRRRGLLGAPVVSLPPPLDAPGAVVAGSCSTATRAQVDAARAAGLTVVAVDPHALAADDGEAARLADRAVSAIGPRPVVVTASAPPAAVAAAQAALGVARAAALVEGALAGAAAALVEAGVRRLVVAGGETSGAVVAALGRRSLHIGPELAPGVPIAWSTGEPPLVLALKSGNFGGPDFFVTALAALGG